MSRIPNTFASAETEKKELLMKLEKGELLCNCVKGTNFTLNCHEKERKENSTWNGELNFLYIFSPHHFLGWGATNLHHLLYSRLHSENQYSFFFSLQKSKMVNIVPIRFFPQFPNSLSFKITYLI